MFEFKLDGQVVEDPIGWDKFQETLEFDDNLKGVLSKFNSKLTFHGDGYAYLSEQYRIQGYCHLVDLEIKEDCGKGLVTIFKGFIFLSDVKFTISEKCLAECSIEDQSFSSKINNNKSTEAKVDVARSKNDVAITAAPTIAVNFRDPLTLATTRTVDCWDVQEVFRMMIEFMTDGTVGFTSDYLTNLPTTERIAITTGELIRTGAGDAPIIKYKHLFEEVWKKYNVAFAVEQTTSGPVIRLEQLSYFRGDVAGINILNIKELTQRFDNQLLFSHVKLGANDTEDFDPPNNNMPDVRFITFQDETFNIGGDCNIDKELDLNSDWQIDSNVIEHALNGVNDDYDEDTFIIQYEQAATNQTSNIDYLGLVTPVYGFNDQLRSSNVADRFNLQGVIAMYLGDGNDEFKATRTSLYNVVGAVPGTLTFSPVAGLVYGFEDDSTGPNFDPNANYRAPGDPGANPVFSYLAPATGFYEFETTIKYEFLQACDTNLRADVKLRRFTGAGVFIEEVAGTGTVNTFLGAIYSETLAGSFNMDAGDYLFVEIDMVVGAEVPTGCGANFADYDMIEGSTFECIATTTGGGIYDRKEPEDYFTSIYEFKEPLSREKWNDLKSNLAQSINFDGRQGWIKQIVHTYETKETQLKLLSNG